MNSIEIGKIFNQIHNISLATQELFDKTITNWKNSSLFKKRDIFVPDEMALMPDYRSYFDVIDHPITPKIVAKWELLQHLANKRQGKLFLFVNEKYMQEVTFVLQENQISATIQSI